MPNVGPFSISLRCSPAPGSFWIWNLVIWNAEFTKFGDFSFHLDAGVTSFCNLKKCGSNVLVLGGDFFELFLQKREKAWFWGTPRPHSSSVYSPNFFRRYISFVIFEKSSVSSGRQKRCHAAQWPSMKVDYNLHPCHRDLVTPVVKVFGGSFKNLHAHTHARTLPFTLEMLPNGSN